MEEDAVQRAAIGGSPHVFAAKFQVSGATGEAGSFTRETRRLVRGGPRRETARLGWVKI